MTGFGVPVGASRISIRSCSTAAETDSAGDGEPASALPEAVWDFPQAAKSTRQERKIRIVFRVFMGFLLKARQGTGCFFHYIRTGGFPQGKRTVRGFGRIHQAECAHESAPEAFDTDVSCFFFGETVY